MPSFDYFCPTSVDDALALLAEVGEGAHPVAGATDLWVDLRAKKLAPKAFVSLKSIPELKGIKREAGALVIGALTPHAEVEDSEWIAENLPALHQACAGIGSRQIRNAATVGGNVCNAAPCADSAVALLLYDAVASLKSAQGTREVPLHEFFLAPGETVLKPNEILTHLTVPYPEENTYSGYWKHTRRRGVELPLLGVGARVTLAPDRTVTKARVTLGVAYPTPARAREAEQALEGRVLTEEVAREAAEQAASCCLVRNTWRGKAWYRREMVHVLIPRVLRHAGAL